MQHMGVDHRRFDVAMAQQLLNCAYVGAAFEPVRDKGVREVWHVDRLVRPTFTTASLTAFCSK